MCFKVAGRKLTEIITPVGIAVIIALVWNTRGEVRAGRQAMADDINHIARAVGGQWLSTEEAAERLGIKARTVIDRIADGRLQAVKVDGQWRVDPLSVAASAADGL